VCTRSASRIPKVVYAIFPRVLYNLCYDMRWDRLSHKTLVHKIEKWVARPPACGGAPRPKWGGPPGPARADVDLSARWAA
jgi:hypothetical protein